MTSRAPPRLSAVGGGLVLLARGLLPRCGPLGRRDGVLLDLRLAALVLRATRHRERGDDGQQRDADWGHGGILVVPMSIRPPV